LLEGIGKRKALRLPLKGKIKKPLDQKQKAMQLKAFEI